MYIFKKIDCYWTVTLPDINNIFAIATSYLEGDCVSSYFYLSYGANKLNFSHT